MKAPKTFILKMEIGFSVPCLSLGSLHLFPLVLERKIRDGEGCNMFGPEGGKGSYILLVSQDRRVCWNVDMDIFKC